MVTTDSNSMSGGSTVASSLIRRRCGRSVRGGTSGTAAGISPSGGRSCQVSQISAKPATWSTVIVQAR
jgi:hypothetical protein